MARELVLAGKIGPAFGDAHMEAWGDVQMDYVIPHIALSTMFNVMLDNIHQGQEHYDRNGYERRGALRLNIWD